MRRAVPTRRAVLAASAAALPLLLTACKGVQALGTPPPPAPDIVTLRAAISAEAAWWPGTGLHSSRLSATSRPRCASRHRRVVGHHGRACRARRAPGSAQVPASRSLPAALRRRVRRRRRRRSRRAAGGVAAELTALAQAEQAASDRLIGQLTGLPPSLAQLFASIAASEATHVPYLQAARRGR